MTVFPRPHMAFLPRPLLLDEMSYVQSAAIMLHAGRVDRDVLISFLTLLRESVDKEIERQHSQLITDSPPPAQWQAGEIG